MSLRVYVGLMNSTQSTQSSALRSGPTLAEMRQMTQQQRTAQLNTEWADCGGLKGLKARGKA